MKLTSFLSLLCFLLFVSIQMSTQKEIPPLFTAPAEEALLYDYPEVFSELKQLLEKFGPQVFSLVPPREAEPMLQKIDSTPYWRGLYQVALERRLPHPWPPLFEKIQQGQMWRLFSPILLHADLLHLFFNLIWFFALGKQIEARIGSWRFLSLILAIAVFSNTAQYLMSGPAFLGLSGIVTGFAGFIWTRQRTYGESYPLQRVTAYMIFAFILGVASLEAILFLLSMAIHEPFSLGIANTAHLAGAWAGFAIGKTSFFRIEPV